MNTPDSEHFFILRLQSGDMTAFNAVFRRFYARLCSYAFQIVHDRSEAESVVDDVMLGLWENHANIDPSQPIENYLLTAVRNRSINALKTMMRRPQAAMPDILEDEAEMLATVFVDENQPASILMSRELEEKVHAAIDSLPDECRTVFKKSRFEQKSYKEIAQDLGVSVNTVKYHIKRAIALLQDSLGGYLRWLIIIFLIEN